MKHKSSSVSSGQPARSILRLARVVNIVTGQHARLVLDLARDLRPAGFSRRWA